MFKIQYDQAETGLTLLTVVGMALASLALFWADVPAISQIGLVGLIMVYFAGGVPAAIRALGEAWREHVLDIDLLMVVAAVAAASVGAALEGAVLLTLFSISSTLEHRAMGKARRAVEALMALRPSTAILADGREVPVAQLQPGDVVVVRPGARVPVDGVITTGEGSIDESTITGESMPVHKASGAKVFEATVNLNGVLHVTVSRLAEDSTVARMVALVIEAQAAKAPSERFSDWFGQRYTVAVLLGSVTAFGVFMWLGWGLDLAMYRAATLLVAASPCAVVISVPAAILSALSAAARGGVLFKGGAALETLAAVKTFAFDKTGTLTTGRAEVVEVVTLQGSEDAFLRLLAGLEAHSEHPIASAIRAEVSARGLEPLPVSAVTASPSEGITGRDAEGEVWAGNPRMLARMGAPEGVASLHNGTHTVIYMGRGSNLDRGGDGGRPTPRQQRRRYCRAACRRGAKDRHDDG